MRKVFLILVWCFSLVSHAAFADDNSRKAAEELLVVTDLKVIMEQSIDQTLSVQLQQHPELLPYRNIMLKFFQKYMSYESVKPDMIELYAELFTSSELNDISTFYKTPVGKKALSLMPTIMSKGAQIGMTKVQGNLGELQQMINAETERLKQQQVK